MAKEFIFKEAQHLVGTSQKTGNPYDLRKIRFVDPATFDTHQMDFDEKLDRDVKIFSNGDRVHIDTELRAPRYGNQDSRAVAVGIRPIKL